MAPRPAPQTARLVQFCCQHLLTVEAEFAAVFHDELCSLAPSLQLPQESGPLSAELAHCVLWAALAQDPVDVIETTVRSFAAGHRGRGFPMEAYENLGHTLVRAVRTALPMGWTSELSSGWVSYALWLQPHLQAGARSVTIVSSGGVTRPLSLQMILAALRRHYFATPDGEGGLSAICTRVMLRTGADLRDPRPEQNTDPAVINEVLESLLLMGYAPVAGIGGTGGAAATVGGPESAPAGTVPAAASGRRRRRWWRPRQRTS